MVRQLFSARLLAALSMEEPIIWVGEILNGGLYWNYVVVIDKHGRIVIPAKIKKVGPEGWAKSLAEG